MLFQIAAKIGTYAIIFGIFVLASQVSGDVLSFALLLLLLTDVANELETLFDDQVNHDNLDISLLPSTFCLHLKCTIT